MDKIASKLNEIIPYSDLFELFVITNIILGVMLAIDKTTETKDKPEFQFWRWFFWNIGSLGTYTLLEYLDVLEATHQTFALVGFTWNRLFSSLRKKFNDESEKGKLAGQTAQMVNAEGK